MPRHDIPMDLVHVIAAPASVSRVSQMVWFLHSHADSADVRTLVRGVVMMEMRELRQDIVTGGSLALTPLLTALERHYAAIVAEDDTAVEKAHAEWIYRKSVEGGPAIPSRMAPVPRVRRDQAFARVVALIAEEPSVARMITLTQIIAPMLGRGMDPDRGFDTHAWAVIDAAVREEVEHLREDMVTVGNLAHARLLTTARRLRETMLREGDLERTAGDRD